jgi:hypothetical protein
LFNRLGNVVAMRDLLLYGANEDPSTDAPVTRVGLLALCANDFVESDPTIKFISPESPGKPVNEGTAWRGGSNPTRCRS